MIPRLPIFNFEHGLKTAGVIQLGPYTIRVESAEHLDEHVFASNGGLHLTHNVGVDGGLQRQTSTLAPRIGRWTETAVIEEHADLTAQSLLFPEVNVMKGSHDVALLLWFMTGREVAIGNQTQPKFQLGGTPERLVSTNFFYFPTINWSSLPTLATRQASDALYAVCLALTIPDLLPRICLASMALDALVSRWYKDSIKPRYTPEIRSDFTSALGAYQARLHEMGVPNELIDDVIKRIPNLLNPSALEKLRAFLLGHDMLDTNAPSKALERIRMLNTYRNTAAHQAKLPIDVSAPFDRELTIAGAVSSILLKICRVYLAKHLLEIRNDTYGIEHESKSVREFFNTGKLHGHDVFNEPYNDFARRVTEAWEERGEFPI